MTAVSNTVRITPKLIVGLGILVLGMLWTLDNLHILESERITAWWPIVLVAIGFVRLLNPEASKVGSAVLIVLGTGLLLDSLHVWNFDVGDLIPLGIAAIGGKLIWDAIARRDRPPMAAVDDPSSELSAFAMMAGVRRQSTSHEFRGADASAIMGGVELDLRHARIRDGESATIDATAIMGGVDIFVPEDWRVVSKVLPIMGGFEDKTRSSTAKGPVLIVRGTAIMGAVEVKN